MIAALAFGLLATSCDGSDQTPCDGQGGGTIDQACVEWAVEQCEGVPVDSCDGHMLEATSAGEVACATAGALAPKSMCAPGPAAICVAAFHTGDGGPTKYFSGDQAYEVTCGQSVPCPARILGFARCRDAGSLDGCDCQ